MCACVFVSGRGPQPAPPLLIKSYNDHHNIRRARLVVIFRNMYPSPLHFGRACLSKINHLSLFARFLLHNMQDWLKRNETKRNETKRNETKRNETKRNKTKQNKTKQNKTKRNKTKQKTSFHFISLHFIPVRWYGSGLAPSVWWRFFLFSVSLFAFSVGNSNFRFVGARFLAPAGVWRFLLRVFTFNF